MILTVAYRVPVPIYERAEALARARGCKLSAILREATAAGLAVLAGDNGGGVRRVEVSNDGSR